MISYIKSFKNFLENEGKSNNTIRAYISDISLYLKDKDNYFNIKKYSVSTLERRKCSYNIFCDFISKPEEKFKKKFKKSRTFQRGIIEIRHVQAMINFLKENLANVKTFTAKRRIYQQMIFLSLGIHEGLRASEYHNINFVDALYKNEINIKNSKNGNYRTLPITKITRKIISELKEFLENYDQTVHNEIFKNQDKYISIRTFQRWAGDIAKKADIPRKLAHTHSLRHRFAMNFLKANPQNFVHLSNIMGHKSIQTTLIYATPTKKELQKRMDKSCFVKL